MSSDSYNTTWNTGGDTGGDVCTHFQVDLSCLADGELDDAAATRAMLHLEGCDVCRSFFEDTRTCMRLHLDVAEPDRLLSHISTLTGFAEEARGVELVHKLATIFYQLGKAYTLAAIDPDFRTRVFEEAVAVETTQTQGRGFIDGVVSSGDSTDRVDWEHARHMLNGRLKQIESPLEKGRKLLEEAIAADPSHEEARLYMAYLHAHEGKRLKAAAEYRDVFRTALDDANRGHAAMQLGILHDNEDDYRKALACFRWLTVSGLVDRDKRFFFARFNIGLEYALMGRMGRSLEAFRSLLDSHPDRIDEVADVFAHSKNLQRAIESQPGFIEALLERCPELFQGITGPAGGSSGA